MDALDPGPGGKALQVAGLAGCPGEGGMDVKISDIAHFFVAIQKGGNRCEPLNLTQIRFPCPFRIFPWKMGGLLLKKSLYNVHCISKIF
jgi:hypothetical protein